MAWWFLEDLQQRVGAGLLHAVGLEDDGHALRGFRRCEGHLALQQQDMILGQVAAAARHGSTREVLQRSLSYRRELLGIGAAARNPRLQGQQNVDVRVRETLRLGARRTAVTANSGHLTTIDGLGQLQGQAALTDTLLTCYQDRMRQPPGGKPSTDLRLCPLLAGDSI